MSGSNTQADVVPACLAFLAIYNPSLSYSDETVHEQIVYYYDKERLSGAGLTKNRGGQAEDSNNDKNERLRQIGLAQGMVQFARYLGQLSRITFG